MASKSDGDWRQTEARSYSSVNTEKEFMKVSSSLQNAGLAPDNFAVDDNTKQLIRKYEERFEKSKKTQEIEEHSRFPLEKE